MAEHASKVSGTFQFDYLGCGSTMSVPLVLVMSL
jgi:hypothetical protein